MAQGKVLRYLVNGDSIGRKSNLRNCAKSPLAKQNGVYTTNREFLRNYKTAVGKEDALQRE